MLAYYPHAACFRFTYRLKDGTLSLSGEIANRSGETMPLSLGFHPYFAFAKGEARPRAGRDSRGGGVAA